MSLKNILIALGKYLALAVLYLVLFNLSSGLVPTGLNWSPPPETLPLVFAGISLLALVNTAVISLVIGRSGWGGWRLIGATALAWFGVMTVMAQIETAWFARALSIPYQVAIAVLVNAMPLVAIFTIVAVWVWGKWRQPASAFDAGDRLPQTAGEWAWKLAVIAPLYLALYFGFGLVVAWQNPALREMYANGADPVAFNYLFLIPLQIARSALWVLFAVPVIRMTRGPLWQTALLVGLLYALPMNIGHFIPNPIMPEASVRMSHFIETASSNFLYGLAVTWILSWRPVRVGAGSAQPLNPEAPRRSPMNVKNLLKTHSLLAYFTLAYGLTWGGLLLVAASLRFQFDQIGLAQIGLMFLAMAAGPSLSSALLTSVLDGRAGWRDLGARLGRWRLGLGWYAIAVLTVPMLTLFILLGLTLLVYPDFRPGFAGLGLMVGLLAGFFEELGWTGFALPRLQRRFSPFMAGLVLGGLWAVWHGAADFMGNIQTMGAAWLPHYIIYWILPLTAYRILMTWVYKNTGSLLLAQLMHAGYTGSQILFSPPAASFADGLLWKPIFMFSLWLLVAAVAAAYGSSLARQPAALAERG